MNVELKDHPHLSRYRLFPTLNALELRTAAGAADLVLSRAGSGSIFEISCWERPAILVPIPENVSRDQRKNAYAYARTGGAEVIEQHNFTPNVLSSEVDRIIADVALRERMQEGAKKFQKPNAARIIAQELLRICMEHEV
jgi:UDP-N-acetylglucosamine--N-acetylmuramyl-(pentapeptide) pyrophosphoryl-undecaprenol N-acetylglucosamine transferase